MRKLYLILCVWVAGLSVAFGQQESTLYGMPSLHQANYLNPAIEPQQVFYLGLPGISSVAIGAGSNSLNYDAVQTSTDENGDEVLDVATLRTKLKDKNYLTQTAEVDALSLGFRLNAQMYLHYRSTVKILNRAMFTPGILDLYEDLYDNMNDTNVGLADFTISPAMEHMTYAEHVLGASYKIDRKLTVGANLKFLRGLTNVHTEALSLSIQSDPNAQLFSAQGNMLAYTSGDIEELEETELDDYQRVLEDMSKNKGFAVDLGATYQLNNRLTLGMSLLNIGGISWTNEAKEYKVDNASFSFEQLDPDNMQDDEVDSFLDSPDENFIPEERIVSKYRTALPKKMYLTASYELYRNVQANGILFFRAYEGRFTPGFTASLSKDFGRRFGATLSYTAVNNTYTNIGAGFSFRLTPFQLYVVTDNALGALNYEKAQHLNIRAGLNFVIGTIKKPSKLPYAQN